MNTVQLLISSLFVLLGLVMFFSPTNFISAIIMGIGIATLISGIKNLVTISKSIDDTFLRRTLLIRSIVTIAVGIFAISVPLLLAKTIWIIVLYILAGGLFISAILELLWTWKLKQLSYPYKEYLIKALVSIICALLLIAIPRTDFGMGVVQIIGVIVVFGGVAGIALGTKKR